MSNIVLRVFATDSIFLLRKNSLSVELHSNFLRMQTICSSDSTFYQEIRKFQQWPRRTKFLQPLLPCQQLLRQAFIPLPELIYERLRLFDGLIPGAEDGGDFLLFGEGREGNRKLF